MIVGRRSGGDSSNDSGDTVKVRGNFMIVGHFLPH